MACNRSRCSRRSVSHASSPSAAISSVEPTMSVNTTVTVTVGATHTPCSISSACSPSQECHPSPSMPSVPVRLGAYSSAVSSVVSLLVTDIVDSTRLWVRFEREMSADLVVHDDLVTKLVDLYGGRVFKRTGDGAMAVF